MSLKSYRSHAGLVIAIALAAPVSAARGQWVTTAEQFYLEAPHNWVFHERYNAAHRLFNGFDFGHAILYETLWRSPNAPTSELEDKWYDRLTTDILVRPPHVPLEESAVEIAYVKLAPEAKLMFEWAHVLHRQLYDILADERLTQAEKDREVARLIAYYKTRPDLAFSSRPKSMALMQEQPYSLAFRRKYPKFNGLIWAYHWLQIGLYEPLLVHTTAETRQSGVRATVARFWQMLDSVPANMPHVMPMTAAVAPRFAERYPEAAIIFDNLHSMHDVISDILANPSVPRNRKRAEILLAARRYRDDTSFVVTPDAWRTMASHMGIENMGGPSVGFLPDLPTPTVTYGAVMTHDATGAMTGFTYGSAVGGAHAQHGGEVSADTTRRAPDEHAHHDMPAAAAPARTDSAAVVDVVAQFNQALARTDTAAALALLAPDVVVLESGGIETLAEYRAHHLGADMAFSAGMRSERTVRRVEVRGDMASVASTSISQGQFRGRDVNSAGAELMVLTRTAAGWRISAIHWSSRARRGQ